MATTLLQLKQLVKLEVNEVNDAQIATLFSGTAAGVAVTTTDQAITRLLFDAGALLAMSCYPLRAFAYKTAVRGDFVDRFDEFLIDDTDHPGRLSYLWAAAAVEYDGVPLTHINRTHLENNFPYWRNGIIASSTETNPAFPEYWSEEGMSGIVIYPGYPDAKVVGVHGFQIPPRGVDGTDDNDPNLFNWLSEHLMHLLVDYVVFRICIINKDDPSIYQRALDHMTVWNATTLQMWNAIDLNLRSQHFTAPPMLTAANSAGGSVGGEG